ncbi:MAG: PEP-CTERM system TPR-repeat protein PrsT [Rhizobacter sp.]
MRQIFFPSVVTLRSVRRTGLAFCAAALVNGWVAHSAWAAGDPKASRFYEDALTRYEKRDIPGAIIQLKNALQIDKNMLPVQVLLGKALLANGEAAAAEVALNEALRLGVNRAEIVVPLADAYVGQGKQRQMLDQPQFSPAGLPPTTQMQLMLVRASAMADLGDSRGALSGIESARAIDPRSPDTWLAEVSIRIRGRQYQQAEAAVERALSLAPNAAEAWYQKGAVAHVQGNLKQAVASYDKALQLDGTHVEARVARTGLRIDNAQFGEAEADVLELRRVAPREPRGAYMQALLAEREGKKETVNKALAEVTSLIDPVPLDFIRYRPQLLMLNGLAHFGLGQRDKAKAYLENFQKVQGNSAASKLLAQLYLDEPDVARAVSVLEGYVAAQPADSQALTLLASAYMAQGRSNRATNLMQDALKTRDDPAFRTALGLSLIGGKQSGLALKELEEAWRKDPKQTRAGMALVNLYLRSGQATKALTVAESLVRQQPNNAGLHNLLGMSRGDANQLEAARASFEQALKLDPNLVATQLNLARLDIRSRAFDAAQTRLAALIKSDEKNTEALLEMAALAQQRGQTQDVLRWLDKANDVEGTKGTRAGLALVDFHLSQGRALPALDAAKRLTARAAPDNLSVLLATARALIATGDQPGARATLTSAARFAEFDAPQQLQVASLQLAANNPPGAAYSLDKALAGRPDYLPALALLTEVELRQGDAAGAEKRARDIVGKHPRLAIGHSLLGDVALSRQQLSPAIEHYRRAHQTEPSTDTLLRLMRTQLRAGEARSSLGLAEQWVKSRPKDFMVQRALAEAYNNQGQFKQAKATYENLIMALPEDAPAMNNLAMVLTRLGDPAAVAMAERALSKAPNQAEVIDTLGWALFLNGQTDRALQLLRDARLRNPSNPDIRYHLAAVLAQTGRSAEAKAELEAAVQAGPSFDSYSNADKLLKSLQAR